MLKIFLVSLTLASLFFPKASLKASPGDRGSFKVYKDLLKIPITAKTNIDGKIFAPSHDGGSYIPHHKFPLVILVPAFSWGLRYYEEYALHLASHGYMVMGLSLSKYSVFKKANHKQNAKEVVQAITFILSKKNHNHNRYIDTSKIAVSGHSVGGKVAFYAASLDPRIKLVLAMDPVNIGGPPCFISPKACHNYPVAPNPKTGQKGVMMAMQAKALIFRAKPDWISNPEPQFNGIHFWYGLKNEGYLLNFARAKHLSWIRKKEVIEITKRTMVAYLQQEFFLLDRSAYFDGAIIDRDIKQGILSEVRKK